MCAKAFPQAGQLYSHKKTHGINPRVTKDPPPGTNIPQRGRKRKTKVPDQVVLSPPPVAYLIESMHQPSQQFQTLSAPPKQKKGNKVNNSKYNLGIAPPQVKDEQNKPKIVNDVSDFHGRRKLIPVTRDQYQHFLQNQQMYFQAEQHHYQHQLQHQQNHQQLHSLPYQPRFETKNFETNLPTSSTLTYSHKNDLKNLNTIRHTDPTPQSSIPVKMEDVPSHLKDLERLIPSDQT